MNTAVKPLSNLVVPTPSRQPISHKQLAELGERLEGFIDARSINEMVIHPDIAAQFACLLATDPEATKATLEELKTSFKERVALTRAATWEKEISKALEHSVMYENAESSVPDDFDPNKLACYRVGPSAEGMVRSETAYKRMLDSGCVYGFNHLRWFFEHQHLAPKSMFTNTTWFPATIFRDHKNQLDFYLGLGVDNSDFDNTWPELKIYSGIIQRSTVSVYEHFFIPKP